jgi:putative tryptophan/tyrosine transport system substrate-binding protein
MLAFNKRGAYGGCMQRREFISFLGGAAATLPLAARAQQSDRVRRLGVLVASTADDPEWQTRIAAFQQGLLQLGWSDGRNVQIDTRWATTKPDDVRRHAAELAALALDVIFAGSGTAAVAPLLQATRTVPIVFVLVIDPVGAGFIDSLSRPGGNATGFTVFEYGMSGKWLELLKQIAPTVTRAAVFRDPTIVSGIGQFAAVQAVAPSLGVDLSAVDVRDAGEIERAVTKFARSSNGGLIVTASTLTTRHRDLIIGLAARFRLPAVYPFRLFVSDGGLISYGADANEPHRRAAGYIDRILKGEKPGDLPVQAPTKYQLVINLKTAKALDLAVSPSLLARADEVIDSSS